MLTKKIKVTGFSDSLGRDISIESFMMIDLLTEKKFIDGIVIVRGRGQNRNVREVYRNCSRIRGRVIEEEKQEKTGS